MGPSVEVFQWLQIATGAALATTVLVNTGLGVQVARSQSPLALRRRGRLLAKTSLVAFMKEDHPGALLEILDQLTMRGVNLTRIESRPTGHALGDYCFSIDAEGHVADRRVGEALMGLRRVCADVRFLGSYERHDGKPPRIRPGTTDAEFEDFNLKLEVRTLEGSNSGIYLRGIYEVQVMESFNRPVDSHHMGALYSRITPSVAAEKPIGEWQTLDITLVDRHLNVVLNGKTIIDNQPVLGCTGGALTSDETKPGPIFLQGDHTDVDYRNIVLRPVVE